MKSRKLPIEAVTVVAFEKRIFNRMPLTHKRKMKVWADKCEYGRLHTFIDEHGYDRWDEFFRRREGRFFVSHRFDGNIQSQRCNFRGL